MKLDVEYNEQWFLRAPYPAAQPGDRLAAEWARRSVENFNRADEWLDPMLTDTLVETILDQSTLFTDDAAAAFLYCPRGMPATAVVEIVMSDVDGGGSLAALDLIPDDETALPRQVVDTTAAHLGDGFLVHGLALADGDQPIGIASYSFVSQNTHVLVTVTSPDLNAFTLGRPHLDEFVNGISLHP